MRLLNINNIICIEIVDRSFVFYTTNNKYYEIKKLDDVLIALESRGFKKINSNQIINIQKIKRFDKQTGVITYINSQFSFIVATRKRREISEAVGNIRQNLE